MRSATVAVCVILFASMLAGCIVKTDKTSPKDASSSASTSAGADNSTQSANTTANASAPVAKFVVIDNGTSLAPVNGSLQAKAGVNLTFNGTSSEGANLTFAWTFGDNGTADNASVIHAFAAAGNYSVTLQVTSGNQSNTATANLTIASSGPAPGTVLREDKKHSTGTYTLGVQTGLSCAGSTSGSGASASTTWEIPAKDASGASIAVTKWVLKATGGTTNLDQAMRFAGPDGKVIKDTDDNSPPSSATESATIEGTFPPGKYTVTLYACTAVNGAWTFDGTATLVAA